MPCLNEVPQQRRGSATARGEVPRHFLTGEELSAGDLAAAARSRGRAQGRARGWPRRRVAGREDGRLCSSRSRRRAPGSRSRSAWPSSADIRCRCAPTSCSSGAASRSQTPPGCCLATCTRLVIRSGSDETVAELAAAASMPVINALTPLHHPCQALADLLTLRERFGGFDGVQRRLRRRRQQRRPLAGHPRPHRRRRGAGRDAARLRARARPGRARDPRPARGCGRCRRDLRRRLGEHGRRGRRRAPARRRWRRTVSTSSCSRSRRTGRSPCTACPPTPARRSPRASSTASARPSGTRPRTGCTRRRRCSSCSWLTPRHRPILVPRLRSSHGPVV